MAAYIITGYTLITVTPTLDTDSVGSVTSTSTYDVSANVPVNKLFSIDIGNAGSDIYLAEDASPSIRIRQSALTTPYDITSINYVIGGYQSTTAPTGNVVAGFAYAKDGSAFYTAFNNAGVGLVYEWGTATAWDSTTMAYSSQFSPTITDSLALSNDGTKFYTLANNTIYTYTLSTPWRVSSQSLLGNTSLAALTTGTFTDLSFNSTGDELVLLDNLGNIVSLQLATPFVISSYIDRGTRATITSPVGSAGILVNGGADYVSAQLSTSIIEKSAVTKKVFGNSAYARNPNIAFIGSTLITVTPSSTTATHKTNRSILGTGLVFASPASLMGITLAPATGTVNIAISLGVTASSYGGATASIAKPLVISASSSGTYKASEANLTGFTSAITAYSGGYTALSGFNKSFVSTGTVDGYGTAALTGFSTTVSSTVYSGIIGGVSLGGISVGLSSYGGAEAVISKFSSTVSSSVTTGSTALAALGSFTTKLLANVSHPTFGIVALRPPIMEILWGRGKLSGFSTQITTGNTLVVDNTVTYAINIKSSETTQYTNYNFDYIVRLAGKYYGVRRDGLYLLEGNDDAGVAIAGKIKTSDMDYGTSQLKRVPYVYMDSDTATSITPYVDEQVVATYPSNFGGRRTRLARGVKGRFWAFEVSNINGGPMRIGSIEALTETLSRKV